MEDKDWIKKTTRQIKKARPDLSTDAAKSLASVALRNEVKQDKAEKFVKRVLKRRQND